MGEIKIPSMTHLLGNTKKRRAIRKLYEVTKDLAEQGGEYSFYTKPSGGIPYNDLSHEVKSKLDYTPPSNGINIFASTNPNYESCFTPAAYQNDMNVLQSTEGLGMYIWDWVDFSEIGNSGSFVIVLPSIAECVDNVSIVTYLIKLPEVEEGSPTIDFASPENYVSVKHMDNWAEIQEPGYVEINAMCINQSMWLVSAQHYAS